MTGILYVGTSGFAYKEWKGPFYPPELAQSRWLRYYAEQLPSVEINYTFRHLPSDSVLEQWRSQTPEGFRLTLKASQRITHFKRLVGTGEDVAEFVRRAVLLGDRLGVILFQLPATFRFDRSVLEGFLAGLPTGIRAALEFRHESWNDPEVAALLAAHGVATCAADTEATPLAGIPVTAPHGYLRLRKQEYLPSELARWGAEVRRVLEGGRDVYCYFKHEGGGVGPAYARSLRAAALAPGGQPG
jgi:uncharacterized protein YecE (DUF72 family)